ncbi:hypothetical protein [Aggregatilinea lenta]|uniref:hypothetical protein n=1 Tax=Aggregatilinea lenta TaxID=913108 RepID=UPI000E5A26D8|nr:hypothetical protein [Aggregatilinea lenta]
MLAVICKSYPEMKRVARELKLMDRYEAVDGAALISGVYWARDPETVHVRVNDGVRVYRQNGQDIVYEMRRDAEPQQFRAKQRHAWLLTHCPRLDMEWYGGLMPGVRVTRYNLRYSLPLDDYHWEASRQRARSENRRLRFRAWFHRRYPHLYFHIGDMPPQGRPGRDGAGDCAVWCAIPDAKCPDGRRDGTATGFNFSWPPVPTTYETLDALEREAEKASQPGWFFCTHCRTAHPQEDYSGFYFAERRCKTCAAPEWKRKAAAETYN